MLIIDCQGFYRQIRISDRKWKLVKITKIATEELGKDQDLHENQAIPLKAKMTQY